ncbi:MAG: uroporphyrinogen decarboxylase family protein [Ndongobacter sp.]|nr:uroporphyrinogen decarboxylase family protein [Ndongobacter sp.]
MSQENKRELLGAVLNNESIGRVPVGFWWHFVSGSDLLNGYRDAAILSRVVAGHKQMLESYNPDFMKIMSDGFFAHPALVEQNVTTIEGVRSVRPMERSHPWIAKQVEMVQELSKTAHDKMMTFYNVFSPLQALRLNIKYCGEDPYAFQEMMMDYPEELVGLSEIIASDYRLLAEELKKHTKIDGIYYSVQNVQHPDADEDYHKRFVFPTELRLLSDLNTLWENNILHICGYDHFKNKIEYYREYPAKLYNWATHTDGVTMAEGKRIFNAPILGGFDNNRGTLLDSGSFEELETFVLRLIAETGRQGLVIGADCTIPSDIDIRRLQFIRDIAR